MIDKRCPCCDTVQPASVTRTNTNCAEWECSGCGGRWTVKNGHAGEAFVFWPPDIDAAFDNSLEPLFDG
jgi:hypothetical protein